MVSRVLSGRHPYPPPYGVRPSVYVSLGQRVWSGQDPREVAMSIKGFVSACLAAVAAVLALTAVVLLASNWGEYRAARDAGQLVDLLGVSTRISEALAPERGATSVALDGDPAARKTMAEVRATLDEALNATEKLALATPLAEARDVAEGVAKIRTAITDWRSRSDGVIGSDPQKIAPFRKDFVAGMYDVLKVAGGMTGRLERRLFAIDAQVATPASLAETAWQLRDHGGRLATMHLSVIQGGKPFTAEQIHQIDLADGRVQQLWDILNSAAGSPDSSAGLRDGLAKVNSAYMGPFQPLRARVTKAGMADGKYDLDPAEWRRQSAPMLQAIMLMRDAAIGEARRVADEKRDNALRNLLLMGGLMLAAAGVLAFVVVGIGRRVVAPLAELTRVIGDFAGGSRDFSVPHAGRTDEIGAMATAIQVLRDNAREADSRAAREEEAARLRDQHRQRVEAVTTTFVDSIDSVVGGVATAVNGLRASTETLSQTATTTTEQSTVVASAAEEASTNVQTVAAAAEELSHSIQEISRRVAETATATDGAVREAEATNATVRGLAEAARRIGDVVNMITDIASQTNLLALNATIEAARAGDAGKGFAVVAGEVKNLANQTARATDDIQAQVGAIQAETERAVAAIGGIATTIATVNDYTMGIASAVEEQGAATQEIARNVQQAAAGTSEVSQSIGKVLDAARQTGVAAQQLSGLADGLSGESDRLRGNVGGFIAEVRAS
ncbi:Methyl-accepting chemotaxis protein [Paramagnetospirillum magneticum AMB-1]|uniref:Methyl-accepting chemotaxis protein n=2 Tax=Paramagnetospirillum magneticum TaxID=84159 RepID=Q2W0L7_PARM1|nr:Methyl-accepting chemotaxis protein [Paramagnetospirillum magneticum AMB-1]